MFELGKTYGIKGEMHNTRKVIAIAIDGSLIVEGNTGGIYKYASDGKHPASGLQLVRMPEVKKHVRYVSLSMGVTITHGSDYGDSIGKIELTVTDDKLTGVKLLS